MSVSLSLRPDTWEPRRQKHDLVLVLLVPALLVHLVVLKLLSSQEENPLVRDKTISVRLVSAPPTSDLDKKRIESEVRQIPTGKVIGDEPVKLLEDIRDLDVQDVKPRVLLQEVLELARIMAKRSGRSTQQYKSFSVDDFPEPRHREIDPVRFSNPANGAQNLVTKVDSRGQAISKLTSADGREYCLQQRGDPFDKASWMWYRVPVELCGHL